MVLVVLLCCGGAVPGGGAGMAGRGVSPCGGQVRDGEALLGALLPLHKGPGCGAASLRGAQLDAGLRAALDRVNRDLRREGISISESVRGWTPHSLSRVGNILSEQVVRM